MRYPKRQYIVAIIMFFMLFAAYKGPLSHVLFYLEQHHLFLFTSDYYNNTSLPEYITDFVIQFFYYPLLGSALMALILTTIFLLGYYLVKRFIGMNDVAFISVLPSMLFFYKTMSVDYNLEPITITFFFLLFLAFFASILPRNILPHFDKYNLKNKKISLGISIVVCLVYLSGGYCYFIKSFNRNERIMLTAEMYAKCGDWNKVLDYTERYMQSGRNNQLISYFHTLSLYHTGHLLTDLFDYPQVLGTETLYFPWKSNSRISEYGHFLYEDLGCINQAHHWEFEAMVVWGETAPHLLNLAKYNIIMHRPLVAQKFINKLKNTLFYRNQALLLEKTITTGKVAGMHDAFDSLPDKPAYFINVLNVAPELLAVCDVDKSNEMAFEYLLAYALLKNDVVRLYSYYKEYVDNHPCMKQIPRCLEEAFYIYELQNSDSETELKNLVSPETKLRFKRYYELVQGNQADLLKTEFGNSYWYYVNFISPYGNKVLSE